MKQHVTLYSGLEMNERQSDSMLSLVANTLFCELKEKFTFAMPRVVPDQRATFENDELFRKLCRESEVRKRVVDGT